MFAARLSRAPRSRLAAGFVICVAACGCNRGPDLTFVPVSGQVTYGDAPLADSVVIFAPTEGTAGRFSWGRTDSDGNYTLEADIGGGKTTEGAVPGQYRVGFIRRRKLDGSPVEFDPNAEVGPMAGTINDLPRKYWAMNSELIVTVEENGTNVHNFKLDENEGPGTRPGPGPQLRRRTGDERELPPQPGGMRRTKQK